MSFSPFLPDWEIDNQVRIFVLFVSVPLTGEEGRLQWRCSPSVSGVPTLSLRAVWQQVLVLTGILFIVVLVMAV